MFKIIEMPLATNAEVQARREKLWTYLTKGFKGCEIAKELGVSPGTDLPFATAIQSSSFIFEGYFVIFLI